MSEIIVKGSETATAVRGTRSRGRYLLPCLLSMFMLLEAGCKSCDSEPVPEPLKGALFEPDPSAGPARIYLATTKGESPDELVVEMRVDQVPGLFGGQLTLTYPTGAIELGVLESGALLDGGALASRPPTADSSGKLEVGFALPDSGSSGVIARFTVKVFQKDSRLDFQLPTYGEESHTRQIMARNGTVLGGIQYFGGSFSLPK